ncbi:alpha/beta hydrolase [Roseibium aquae]|uniref:Alpha/beta hydrolase n=1 Tax=Roseibium aquae TaxID=1323746 RepID=A0A916X2U5_9HYPH|nr:alpha/beta hydrolase [Roseibium aquae]GGB56349.1 alpha/beta hydrolase [Roseibium aquae]
MTTAPAIPADLVRDETAHQSKQFRWISRDGLRLSGEIWTPRTPSKPLPVLCLPGLSRNTKDFHAIAGILQDRGYRVMALDYRGRGKSDWDPNWQNYTMPIESQDIDDAIAHLNLDRFAVLGTSRGGLHAMAMGQRYDKRRLAGVILNDVGPRIEMRAIRRLAANIGRNMTHASFDALAKHLEHGMGPQFPTFTGADWLRYAHQLGSKQHDEVVLDYDAALAHQLASLDEGAPWPDLWPLFDSLEGVPLQVIHGETSDLLSRETCQAMQARHQGMELITVKDQGHTPMLWDEETQLKIAGFLDRLS